mmetsp:Transcript_29913/g.48334  ORF Transcript_29913/g.48334 Transcript_29913/m.48334 type:complete len:332 (+) Transcript_29913:61-1056(+)
MQGVGQNFGRLPKVLLFLCLAEVIEGQGSCESSLLQTHAPNAPEPSEAASCLSFIHIPKTGGFSMEIARLSAAGINAPEGKDCAVKIQSIRNGSLDEDVDPVGSSGFGISALETSARRKSQLGRFWGSCDDLLQCSYPEGEGYLCFPGRAGKLAEDLPSNLFHSKKTCSRWHVPPGLDPKMAKSLNQNCDSFVVVRDPMERMRSEFNWLRKGRSLDSLDTCTSKGFEDFVRRNLQKTDEGLEVDDCHFLPQVYYVFENGDHKNGKQLSRHVLKLKELSREFPALMARYGHENVKLTGEHMHPGRPCHVTPTKATVKLVRSFYKADYEAFGF